MLLISGVLLLGALAFPALALSAPDGWQDENGFHFGRQTDEEFFGDSE